MVSRLAGITMGLALLWYGSSQISVAGLVVMLIGLIVVVSAAAPPRLSSPPRERPASLTLTVDMRTPHAQS